MQNDRRLFALLKPVKGWFTLTVLAGIFSNGMTIAMAWLLTLVIDGVFLQHHSLNHVQPMLLGLAGLAGLRGVFIWLGHVFGKRTTTRIKASLRSKILKQLVRLGPLHIKSERTGELTQTLSDGIEKLDPWFSDYLPQLIVAVVVPIIILMVVFPLDILSGIVFLLTAPLIPIFMILIGQMAKKQTQRQWKVLSWMSAHFLDMLQGLTTLKILGRSKAQIQNIERISDEYRQVTMNVLKIAFLSALVLELVGTISIAVIAVEVGLRLLYGKMAFQSALFILLLAPEYYQPLRELGTRFHAGMAGVEAGKRLFEILELPAPKHEGRRYTAVPDMRRTTIQFQGASFQYPQAEIPAVENVTFDLQPGKTTALVGATGAGKSTIAQLLMGFLQPTSGHISLGEVELPKVSPVDWRQQIGWVPQRPHLFYGSLLDNLTLAKPDATKSQIDHAVQQAGLTAVIRELPAGLDTRIGENGVGLSGGQAQRVAIARAILKDAPILVLDEFTTNLDVHLEAELLEALQHLQKNRTTLLIAHRLNTIIHNAHQIIVLDQGKIVQVGEPDKLLKHPGPFKNLLAAYDGELLS